jgi:hypothetical protein
MATGQGPGSLLPVVMTIVGIATMLRARRKRKDGTAPADTDTEAETRKAASAEVERRMASYLAQRDSGRVHSRPKEPGGQENGQ